MEVADSGGDGASAVFFVRECAFFRRFGEVDAKEGRRPVAGSWWLVGGHRDQDTAAKNAPEGGGRRNGWSGRENKLATAVIVSVGYLFRQRGPLCTESKICGGIW